MFWLRINDKGWGFVFTVRLSGFGILLQFGLIVIGLVLS